MIDKKMIDKKMIDKKLVQLLLFSFEKRQYLLKIKRTIKYIK